MKLAIAVCAAAWFVAGPGLAHELRPGYLALRELGGERWEARFRVPTREGRALDLRVELPHACRELGPRSVENAHGARDTRWSFACAGGLIGREIRIDGLSGTLTDVLVRIERADGTVQTARLLPGAPALRVEEAPGRLDVAGTYLVLGVEHITLGVDHLLFVAALLLVVRGTQPLVTTITAFTLAHSLTLAAATLGFVHVPAAPVEATIALSIVFVAREIVCARRGRAGLATRRPWLVAFVFGLLHGLGFAGALRAVGLPQHAIPLALLGFNVGVEIGQLLFVGLALALATGIGRTLPGLRAPTAAAAYGIGSVAAYWTLERVAAFWG